MLSSESFLPGAMQYQVRNQPAQPQIQTQLQQSQSQTMASSNVDADIAWGSGVPVQNWTTIVERSGESVNKSRIELFMFDVTENKRKWDESDPTREPAHVMAEVMSIHRRRQEISPACSVTVASLEDSQSCQESRPVCCLFVLQLADLFGADPYAHTYETDDEEECSLSMDEEEEEFDCASDYYQRNLNQYLVPLFDADSISNREDINNNLLITHTRSFELLDKHSCAYYSQHHPLYAQAEQYYYSQPSFYPTTTNHLQPGAGGIVGIPSYHHQMHVYVGQPVVTQFHVW